jgi:TolB-like protein/DNA-binding SARP family transcriptional activator/Flp pilus assembly protein TadD
MGRLELTLFGDFRASLASGESLVFPRRKSVALLACLAQRPGKVHTRSRLVGLLWGDSSEEQARASLRQTLTGLRKVLQSVAPPPLMSSGDKLWLDPEAITVDVARFEALAQSETTADLERAAALYRGPFLDGYALRNADGDQWLSLERDRLRRLLMTVLDRLLERRMLAQDWQRSTQIAEMLLSHDLLREDAHRNLMRIYAQRGRRNLALRQYQLCREALARELGVPPEPATEQLFQEIQSQEAPSPESPRDETIPPSAELSGEPPAPGGIDADKPAPSIGKAAPKERLVIAVLPFANIGNDPEQEYFADGLTEDIITDLSQISALCVVARHAVFAFKDSPGQVQRAARGLNANYVLKGSIRKAADRVRITAQLVDGSTGSLVWGHRYDHRLDDIFSLQDEISKSIVDILCVKLLPAELETIAYRPTTSAEAYQFYLLGRSFYLRGIDKRSLTIARDMFANAVHIDPGYARAYAGIAICEFYVAMSDPAASFESTVANADRALALEPGSAEARAARGLASYGTGHYQEAAAHFERALELDTHSFEAYFFKGRCCRIQGDREQAATLFAQAAELRPTDFRSVGLLAEEWRALGRMDAFGAAARRSLERATNEVKAHPDNADAWAFGSAVLASLKESQRAADWATRASIIGPDDYLVQYNLARTYALLGEFDKAVDWLARALEAPAHFRRRMIAWMALDQDIGLMHGHARFKPLMLRLSSISRSGTSPNESKRAVGAG